MRFNTSKNDISLGLLMTRSFKKSSCPFRCALISPNTPKGIIILPSFLAYKSSASQYLLLKYSSFTQAMRQSHFSTAFFKAGAKYAPIGILDSSIHVEYPRNLSPSLKVRMIGLSLNLWLRKKRNCGANLVYLIFFIIISTTFVFKYSRSLSFDILRCRRASSLVLTSSSTISNETSSSLVLIPR